MADLNTKTGKLQSILTARILRGEYPRGCKLPSVRKLAQCYNVSSMTAKMAITELRNMGFVDTKKGSGTFVTYNPDDVSYTKHLNIGLAYLEYYQHHVDAPNVNHPAFVQWFSGVQDHFSPEVATVMPLCYPKYKLSEPTSPVRLAIEAKRLDGLIITGWLTPEEADYLCESKIPFVLVDHYLLEREVATVSRNSLMAFRLLMRYLLELGHKDITFLSYSTDPEIYQRGSAPYVRTARALGNKDFSSENIIVISNDDPTKPVSYSEYIISALNNKPDAIITADELIATRLLSECFKRRIEVPAELSIATLVDAWPGGHIIEFTRTNMLAMQRESVRVASELLERALQGENISNKHILLSPTLIVGESTCSCKDVPKIS